MHLPQAMPGPFRRTMLYGGGEFCRIGNEKARPAGPGQRTDSGAAEGRVAPVPVREPTPYFGLDVGAAGTAAAGGSTGWRVE
jgi:hypothetical protein